MMIIVDIQRDKQFPYMHSLALPTSCATCLSIYVCVYVSLIMIERSHALVHSDTVVRRIGRLVSTTGRCHVRD
jgi:hypothetical protein